MVNADVGPKGNQLKGSESPWGNYLSESGYIAEKKRTGQRVIKLPSNLVNLDYSKLFIDYTGSRGGFPMSKLSLIIDNTDPGRLI